MKVEDEDLVAVEVMKIRGKVSGLRKNRMPAWMKNQDKLMGESIIWSMIWWYALLTKPEIGGIKISSNVRKEVSPRCLIKKRKSDKLWGEITRREPNLRGSKY